MRARLDTAVDQALDRATLQDLLEERQLVHDAMDVSRVQRVHEEMERAEARRLPARGAGYSPVHFRMPAQDSTLTEAIASTRDPAIG